MSRHDHADRLQSIRDLANTGIGNLTKGLMRVGPALKDSNDVADLRALPELCEVLSSLHTICSECDAAMDKAGEADQ